MFGQDRFGPNEDFGATYRLLGGDGLDDKTVDTIIRGIVDYMLPRYRDPAYWQNFPSLREAIQIVAGKNSKTDLLEQTFAAHEVGYVPAVYAETLRVLRKTHPLGVISDIWSTKDLYLDAFRTTDILGLFEHMVFSSDGRHVKPSPALFLQALKMFDCTAKEAIYVGDNLKRDVGGAAGVGMDSIWITNGRERENLLRESDHQPTYIIDRLTELSS